MKTAISIPDELFQHAEKAAKQLGIPRSRLFVVALEEYFENHGRDNITEKLNKIYLKDTPEQEIENISVNILRENLKNDSW